MIFINPIAKYSYNKGFLPLPKCQASAIINAKTDSFELSKKQVAFKSAAGGAGLNLHFPLQEVEELFAKASKEIQKVSTIDEKTRLIRNVIDKFNNIEYKTEYSDVAINDNVRQFLGDRKHEVVGPTFELINFFEDTKKPLTANGCDEIFQYATTKTLNAIKRYELLLEKGLDKNNLSQYQMFEMALDSVIERATRKRITIKVQNENILQDCSELLGMSNYRLYTVFSNLIQNAVKYSPQDTNITIEFTRKNFKGVKYITFSVLDQGIGIPKKERRKVFDGHRASNAVKLGIDGTGYDIQRVNKILKACYTYNRFLITSPLDKNNKNFPGTKVLCYMRLKDN